MAAKSKKSQQASISLYRKIALTFLGLTFAVIVVILYFSFASATVTIVPQQATFPIDFVETFKSDGNGNVTSGVGGITAKGQIFTADKDGSKDYQTQVVADGDPAKATGSVVLFDKSNNPQALVATTRLLTPDGILFRLVKDTRVPANGQVNADVIADKPGKQGEIPPTIFTIPGLNPARQKEVYAQSLVAFIGGSKAARMFSADDLKKAQDDLSAQLAATAITDWEAQLPADLKILDKSVYKEILSSKTDANVGDKVDKFTLTIKVRVAALAMSEKELTNLAINHLKTAVPTDSELINFDEGTLDYSAQKFDQPSGALTLKVTLVGRTEIRSTSTVFDKSKLVGLTVPDATNYLKSLPGVSDVKISLSPFWLRGLPELPDHIRIIIQK